MKGHQIVMHVVGFIVVCGEPSKWTAGADYLQECQCDLHLILGYILT